MVLEKYCCTGRHLRHKVMIMSRSTPFLLSPHPRSSSRCFHRRLSIVYRLQFIYQTLSLHHSPSSMAATPLRDWTLNKTPNSVSVPICRSRQTVILLSMSLKSRVGVKRYFSCDRDLCTLMETHYTAFCTVRLVTKIRRYTAITSVSTVR